MYVVRNKKTKELIHMVNSSRDIDLKPEEVFREFDPKTMELGRFHEQRLPEEFTIEEGVVKEKAAKPRSAKAAAEELKELKALRLQQVSQISLSERAMLIPDHELLNAALGGIYDEKRTKQIQATVKAFREEYHRFRAALEKAKTAEDVAKLEPKFPTKLQG